MQEKEYQKKMSYRAKLEKAGGKKAKRKICPLYRIPVMGLTTKV